MAFSALGTFDRAAYRERQYDLLADAVRAGIGYGIRLSGVEKRDLVFSKAGDQLANTHKDNNEIPLRAREVLPGNRKDFSNYWNLLFYSHGSLSSGMRRCHRCDFTTFPIRRKPIYLGIEILLDQHNRGNCEVHEEPHKS